MFGDDVEQPAGAVMGWGLLGVKFTIRTKAKPVVLVVLLPYECSSPVTHQFYGFVCESIAALFSGLA